MSIEDDLRDSLQRRAAAVHVQPDLDDVSERSASRERRTRRFLTAGLVVALIVGPLAGFAIGSATDGGGGDVATGGGTAGQEIARTAGDSALAAGQLAPAGSLEQLFLRTSADGVDIRAYRSKVSAGAVPPAAVCAPPASCPATPACPDPPTVSSMIVGELSTDAAVTVANLPGEPVTNETFGNVSAGSFGTAEAAPARWVLVFVGTDITKVRATFPSGSTDEMEPVGGVALLASHVTDATSGATTVEALTADGSVAGHTDLAASDLRVETSAGGTTSNGSAESGVLLHSESSSTGGSSSVQSRSSVSSSAASGSGVASSCVTPTPLPSPPSATLPQPGEQPADPAAARAEIELAYSVSYDGAKTPEEKARYQEAPTGVTPEQIDATGFGPQVAGASAKVTDVVFTSPTTATVRYDIAVANWQNQFPGRIGEAVLVDGTWKVARSTICNDISLADVTCPSK